MAEIGWTAMGGTGPFRDARPSGAGSGGSLGGVDLDTSDLDDVDLDTSDLDEACRTAMGIEASPLSGLALVVVSGGRQVYEGYFGARRLAAALTTQGRASTESDEPELPFDSNTRLRVASISKPVTALGLMRLVERGSFDLDRDISDYLGFGLRNPHFPDTPITTRMLLSHVSSLRDSGFYYPPLGARIAELFEPGSRYWADGAHFARPLPGADLSPGRYYSYCNLGYGLVGTMIENVTGERFDRYMDREIFKPLGMDAGFNPGLLGDEAFSNLSPIYRKGPADSEEWEPEGAWRAQIDDYQGGRPRDFVRRLPGSAAKLDEYEAGTNGSLFSPQGGLRISARDLSRIARVFLGGGEAPSEGRGQLGAPRPAARLVSASTIAGMAAPVWRRGAPSQEAEPGSGHVLATGSGLMLTEGPRGRPGLWGHHGSAYGFLGGMYLDFERNAGYVYLIGGSSRDPETFRLPGSGISIWEEGLRAAAEAFIDRL
jgi:D-alanyl-D-alanine carboxypeptidase